ncbi:recombinase family protein [Croceicoccus sp. BE223]|uniref:recombinase family protein n=1 Tax=Croceicoccus sp. BE223 TaxID=2817716 RepID=UPI00286AD8F9|nr:recombinase family protein [Croceicoccus sp. BE223]
MRTAIYARFSSQLQKDSSIEDQVRVCTARAEREGWQVTQVFSDYAISGAVRDRPGLNALIEHVSAGHADQVLAEAIDRLSRDQEDLANIHKRIAFAGARIVTLSEGAVDELQIGFKGTMASLFRKDLADKIRRGQSGRVANGRVPGNVVYGYRKVHRLDAKGEPERGLREIDEDQAAIIRRIYREYLDGESPLAIARRLNAEGIPGPTGGSWNVSTINGDTVRGNGILCNAIYVGELVYNRTRMVRDPQTRRRVPRVNPREEWQVTPVPDLAIITQAEWDAVRERRAETKDWDFKRLVRPKKLLSGLVTCGSCGGNMTIIADGKWGCSNARKTGTCDNRRTMDNTAIERRVLAGMERELLSPDRVAAAVRAYHAERTRLQQEDRIVAARQQKKAADLDRQIDRWMTAIEAGAGDIQDVVQRLRDLRAERDAIAETVADADVARVVTLHPAAAEAYRKAVEDLTATLTDDTPDTMRQARNALRALIDRVTLTPKEEGRGMHIDIDGRLAILTALGQGLKPQIRKGTVPVVAEEGLEPPTRGL